MRHEVRGRLRSRHRRGPRAFLVFRHRLIGSITKQPPVEAVAQRACDDVLQRVRARDRRGPRQSVVSARRPQINGRLAPRPLHALLLHAVPPIPSCVPTPREPHCVCASNCPTSTRGCLAVAEGKRTRSVVCTLPSRARPTGLSARTRNLGRIASMSVTLGSGRVCE